MLSRILEVFHEAGLIRQQILDVERRHITILPVEGKTCLSAYDAYRYIKAAKGCSA